MDGWMDHGWMDYKQNGKRDVINK